MNKFDFLWKVLGRYDQYIVSTNQKATATIGYNTLVVAGVVLKFNDILGLFAQHAIATRLATMLLCVITAVSLFSLWCAFMMVLPYLWSAPKANSAIFFGDVAAHSSGAEYLGQIDKLEETQAVNDLAMQVYAVARGATKKFTWMRLGIAAIVILQLPALMIIFVMKLFMI